MGDLVLARDDETGETGLRPVVRTYETPGLEVFELVVTATDGDTDSYTVTYEHPFWVADTGWISAGELVPGDRLVTADGETATVLDRGVTAHTTTVHNVEVEELHTYFVGDLGVWVHNSSDDCTDKGVIYLRKNVSTGKEYVGQAKPGRFKARKREHRKKKPDAEYEFEILEEVDPNSSRSLDVAEEDWIRAGGDPERHGGRLENARSQMVPTKYEQAGGQITTVREK